MLKAIVHKVPILRSLVAYIVGIVCHEYIPADVSFYGTFVLMIIAYVVSMRFIEKPVFSREWVHVSLLLMAFFMFGAAYSSLRQVDFIAERGACQVHGYVTAVTKSDGKSTRAEFYADTLITQTHKYFGVSGIVSAPDSVCRPMPGDRLHFQATLTPPRHNSLSSFDYRRYLENNSMQFVAYARSCEADSVGELTIAAIAGKIRGAVIDRLEMCGISETNISLLQALFLGDKSRISSDVMQSFSDCGTIHILAVSGLHVGIIYLIINHITGILFWRSRSMKCVANIIGIWFYALLTGLSPSVFRATVMMTSVNIAQHSRMRTDIFNTMAVTLFIILLHDPMNVYSTGLWLSFSAVLGIVTLYKPMQMFNPFRFPVARFLYESGSVTLAAQLATLPIILLVFHSFPNYFMINNLIIVPLAGPIITCTIITFVLGSLFLPLGLAVGGIADGLTSFMIQYAQMAANWPSSVTGGISFGVLECVTLIVVLMAAARFLNDGEAKSLRTLAIATVVFCVSSSLLTMSEYLRSSTTIYEVYRQPYITINENGLSTHLATDTLCAAARNSAMEIERRNRTTTRGRSTLKNRTSVVVGTDTIVVVSKAEELRNMHKGTIYILCGNILPHSNIPEGSRIVLTSKVLTKSAWHEYCETDPTCRLADISNGDPLTVKSSIKNRIFADYLTQD